MNIFADTELTVWTALWVAGGSQTATYKKPNHADITIKVLPETPLPDGFAFVDFQLYKTSRVFRIRKNELNGIMPKEGDKIEYTYDNKTTVYTVAKPQDSSCYEDVGSYGVMLRVYCSIYRD
jgi:hypothetical protein